MGKVKKIVSSVSRALGLSAKAPKIPDLVIPAAQVPAPPAPSAITDTGAAVSIGTSADLKNQRVSGRTSGRSTGSATNFLAGLGRSGLNI